MENKISNAVLTMLRDRWQDQEGLSILKKLFVERMQLDDMQSGMDAVKSTFEFTDLRGVDFSEKDLAHHFLLFDLDLSHSNFSKSKIQGSFQNSNLEGCKFDFSEIISGYFTGANLSAATFRGCVIQDADFENCRLCGVSFENAGLLNVGFQNVDLTSASLSGAHFGRVKFGNTKLRRTVELYEKITQSQTVLNVEGIVWVG